MRKNLKPLVIGLVLAGVIIAAVSAIRVGIDNFASVTVSKTGSAMVPAVIQDASFIVNDENNNYLGTSQAGLYWPGGAENRYPNVRMFYGQPYISDAAGNPTAMDLFPSRQLYESESGNAYYLHQYWVTVPFGVRTQTNFPTEINTATFLDPFEGGTYQETGGFSVEGTFQKSLWNTYGTTNSRAPNQLVQNLGLKPGTLAIWVDGSNPIAGVKSTQASGAQITQSLMPIDFNSVLGGSATAANSLSSAKINLPYRYGAGKVNVLPSFTLVGLSDYLTYEYTQKAEVAGQKIEVIMKTSSGLVGFERAYMSGPKFEDIIPSTITGVYANATGTPEESTNTRSRENDPALDDSSDYDVTSAEGEIEYLGEYTSGGGEIVSMTAVFPDHIDTSLDLAPPPSINLNQVINGELTIPEEVTVTAACTLQPRVDIRVARTRVTWDAYFKPGIGVNTYSITAEGGAEKTIYYPYALSLSNVAAAGRAVFLMNVIDTCTINAQYISGEPFDINSLTDVELNEIVMNPAWDNVKLRARGNEFDWKAFWDNFITWLIVILVIVGIGFFVWLLNKLGLLKPIGRSISRSIKKLFKRRR